MSAFRHIFGPSFLELIWQSKYFVLLGAICSVVFFLLKERPTIYRSQIPLFFDTDKHGFEGTQNFMIDAQIENHLQNPKAVEKFYYNLIGYSPDVKTKLVTSGYDLKATQQRLGKRYFYRFFRIKKHHASDRNYWLNLYTANLKLDHEILNAILNAINLQISRINQGLRHNFAEYYRYYWRGLASRKFDNQDNLMREINSRDFARKILNIEAEIFRIFRSNYGDNLDGLISGDEAETFSNLLLSIYDKKSDLVTNQKFLNYAQTLSEFSREIFGLDYLSRISNHDLLGANQLRQTVSVYKPLMHDLPLLALETRQFIKMYSSSNFNPVDYEATRRLPAKLSFVFDETSHLERHGLLNKPQDDTLRFLPFAILLGIICGLGIQVATNSIRLMVRQQS